MCVELHITFIGNIPKLVARDSLNYVTDQKRAVKLRKGYTRPFYFDIAEMYMDMSQGLWMHMPFGERIDDISEYELKVMRAAEICRRVWLVWNIDHEKRTKSDYEFMKWVNKCAE